MTALLAVAAVTGWGAFFVAFHFLKESVEHAEFFQGQAERWKRAHRNERHRYKEMVVVAKRWKAKYDLLADALVDSAKRMQGHVNTIEANLVETPAANPQRTEETNP